MHDNIGIDADPEDLREAIDVHAAQDFDLAFDLVVRVVDLLVDREPLAALPLLLHQHGLALRACDPKTDDLILSATPISYFMPIFIALLHF